MIIIVAFGAVLATFLGGLFALRFRDKLHLILGFSAGAIIGVAFFDLLPEAISLTAGQLDTAKVTSIVALGFVIYLFLDRFFIGHQQPGDDCERHKHRGRLGAGSLSAHSFLDGLAIGFAFKVSPVVGLIVTFAVLAHDFSDGINTVGLILKGGGSRQEAFKWLLIDAAAPALGILISFLFAPGPTALGIILALFCGFFLYIGASELLPESHHAHPTFWTTAMTVLGIAALYAVISLAG
jgi:ZIP family zinc transporter